jgi:predicted site-specific integrase-resolvase
MTSLDDLMRRADVADCLGVSERTVRRLGRAGAIDEIQVSLRSVRITKSSVARLIAARRITPETRTAA